MIHLMRKSSSEEAEFIEPLIRKNFTPRPSGMNELFLDTQDRTDSDRGHALKPDSRVSCGKKCLMEAAVLNVPLAKAAITRTNSAFAEDGFTRSDWRDTMGRDKGS